MNQLLGAMAILIEYPILAGAIGIVLLALGRRARRRVTVGTGILWLLYAVYEYGMQRRWLCSGECDIRVDLLLIYPVLAIGLVAAGVSLVRASSRPSPPL